MVRTASLRNRSRDVISRPIIDDHGHTTEDAIELDLEDGDVGQVQEGEPKETSKKVKTKARIEKPKAQSKLKGEKHKSTSVKKNVEDSRTLKSKTKKSKTKQLTEPIPEVIDDIFEDVSIIEAAEEIIDEIAEDTAEEVAGVVAGELDTVMSNVGYGGPLDIDSSDDIAIVLVENLPSDRKFLRKRKAAEEEKTPEKKLKIGESSIEKQTEVNDNKNKKVGAKIHKAKPEKLKAKEIEVKPEKKVKEVQLKTSNPKAEQLTNAKGEKAKDVKTKPSELKSKEVTSKSKKVKIEENEKEKPKLKAKEGNYPKKLKAKQPIQPVEEETESEAEEFVDALMASDIGLVELTEDISAQTLPQPHIPKIIEVESESEELVVAPRSTSSSKGSRSTIRLLFNPSYGLGELSSDQEVNLDTVTVNELIGLKDLVQTYQFNFNVDLEYFLSFLHPDFAKNRRNITFITGSSLLNEHPLKNAFKKKFDISEVIASLPNRFASHHSKMMVNFFEEGEVEIIIMTCNLTQLDFGGLTQACWRSGRLRKGKTTTTLGKRFRFDLIRYLAKYKHNVTDKLLKSLEVLNYSSVDIELVASVPGVYPLGDLKPTGESYGYVKLRQVLERNNLLLKDDGKRHNILAQVTSIAYPYVSRKGHTSSIFTHLLLPLMFGDWKRLLEPGAQSSQEHQKQFNYKPLIVFPTGQEIASSNFGFLSGSAVHFKYTTSAIHKQQYEQNIKPYLCKWGNGTQTGREKVTPHVKYYACDNGDDWRTLRWVMVGSHNLSKQAWGYPLAKSEGAFYVVDSYELSVFKPGKDQPLVPVYASDLLPTKLKGPPKGSPVRFPFKVPPTPYTETEKPWSAEVDFGSLEDRWGNTYHGSFL